MKNIRAQLIEKYLCQKFNNELDIFNALINYKFDCYKNDLDPNECIRQYFNAYERRDIYKLLETKKQTDEFIKWVNCIFDSKLVNEKNESKKNKIKRIFSICFITLFTGMFFIKKFMLFWLICLVIFGISFFICYKKS